MDSISAEALQRLGSFDSVPSEVLERLRTIDASEISAKQMFPDVPMAPLPYELDVYLHFTTSLPPVTAEHLEELQLANCNLRLEDYQSIFELPYIFTGLSADFIQRFYRSDPRTYYSIVSWDNRKVRVGLLKLESDSSSKELHIREPAEPIKWVDEYTTFAVRQHVHDMTGRAVRDHRPLDLTVEYVQTSNLTFDYYLRLRRTMTVRMPRNIFESLAGTFVDMSDLSFPPFDPHLLQKLHYQVTADGVVVAARPSPPPPGLSYPDSPLEDFSQFCSSAEHVLGYFIAVHKLHCVHADFVLRFITEAFEQFGPNAAREVCDFDFGDTPGVSPAASPTAGLTVSCSADSAGPPFLSCLSSPLSSASESLLQPNVPRELYRELQRVQFDFITGQEFSLVDVLGSGAFGTVFKAYHPRLRRFFALKVMDLEGLQGGIDLVLNEVATLSALPVHAHLVSYYGARVSRNWLSVVQEYVDGGSLADRLRDIGRSTEAQVGAVCGAVVQALQALAKCGRIHRDLKPANILITKSGAVKLADFGTAGVLTDSVTKRDTYIGSAFWIAPEVARGRPYDGRADVWSLGVCAAELLLGNNPLRRASRQEPPESWAARIWASIPREQLSADCVDFLDKCLQTDMAARATLASLAHHPFLVRCAGAPLHHERAVRVHDDAGRLLALLPLDGHEWSRYPHNTVLVSSAYPSAWRKEDHICKQRERAEHFYRERRIRQWLSMRRPQGMAGEHDEHLLEHYLRCKLFFRDLEMRLLEEASKAMLEAHVSTHRRASAVHHALALQEGLSLGGAERAARERERDALLAREARRREAEEAERRVEAGREALAQMRISDVRQLLREGCAAVVTPRGLSTAPITPTGVAAQQCTPTGTTGRMWPSQSSPSPYARPATPTTASVFAPVAASRGAGLPTVDEDARLPAHAQSLPSSLATSGPSSPAPSPGPSPSHVTAPPLGRAPTTGRPVLTVDVSSVASSPAHSPHPAAPPSPSMQAPTRPTLALAPPSPALLGGSASPSCTAAVFSASSRAGPPSAMAAAGTHSAANRGHGPSRPAPSPTNTGPRRPIPAPVPSPASACFPAIPPMARGSEGPQGAGLVPPSRGRATYHGIGAHEEVAHQVRVAQIPGPSSGVSSSGALLGRTDQAAPSWPLADNFCRMPMQFVDPSTRASSHSDGRGCIPGMHAVLPGSGSSSLLLSPTADGFVPVNVADDYTTTTYTHFPRQEHLGRSLARVHEAPAQPPSATVTATASPSPPLLGAPTRTCTTTVAAPPPAPPLPAPASLPSAASLADASGTTNTSTTDVPHRFTGPPAPPAQRASPASASASSTQLPPASSPIAIQGRSFASALTHTQSSAFAPSAFSPPPPAPTVPAPSPSAGSFARGVLLTADAGLCVDRSPHGPAPPPHRLAPAPPPPSARIEHSSLCNIVPKSSAPTQAPSQSAAGAEECSRLQAVRVLPIQRYEAVEDIILPHHCRRESRRDMGATHAAYGGHQLPRHTSGTYPHPSLHTQREPPSMKPLPIQRFEAAEEIDRHWHARRG